MRTNFVINISLCHKMQRMVRSPDVLPSFKFLTKLRKALLIRSIVLQVAINRAFVKFFCNITTSSDHILNAKN